ncbi:MAG: alkene reductase [Planctomycetes bacterium]|nr:alkene reductase [Planctomycetota bacterium]
MIATHTSSESNAAALGTLFTSFVLNDSLTLPNRIVMAPLTRSMAGPGLVPTQTSADYYARRADAGLIISEATIVTPDGQGYPDTPGLFTEAQVDGWRRVTQAVHDRGGRMFAQLWHVGRLSHPHFQPDGTLPLAPSAVPAAGRINRTRDLNYGPVREATRADIDRIVAAFADAATNARHAGFDGVEIHGANGYLIDQFLHAFTNRRTDEYGGSPENRARFALRVIDAVVERLGAQRVGIRLSPAAYVHMTGSPEDEPTYVHLLSEISRRGLAYVHIGIYDDTKAHAELNHQTASEFVRANYDGVLIGNGGYTPDRAAAAIDDDRFDLVAIGRPFIANPDLVNRLRQDQPLVPYDAAMLTTLY